MRKGLNVFICAIVFGLLSCFGTAPSLKLGECPLTIIVKAEDSDFDGYANVYINGKFIGATDSRNRQLKIPLERGEYSIRVTAEGYEPWEGTILILGKGYKQNVLASLKKIKKVKGETGVGK